MEKRSTHLLHRIDGQNSKQGPPPRSPTTHRRMFDRDNAFNHKQDAMTAKEHTCILIYTR